MADFYELDFFPVHARDSGDAISIRYQIGDQWSVHVIDGGFESTAEAFEKHIRDNYGTGTINRVIVTHPDQDHAEGLANILEKMQVLELWMLRPWDYAHDLLPHFARYSDIPRLQKRLREDYPFIAKLEEIAQRKHIPIFAPFQGSSIGPFTVLTPTRARYLELIIESERTPQRSIRSKQVQTLLGRLIEVAKPIIQFIKSGWGSEQFSSGPTSVENEMSVVQYASIAGHSILLTGDTGRDGLKEAADYYEANGGVLPGIDKFQVPHHGGRSNVSTELLDRWLGPRLAQALPEGSEKFTALISSAKEDVVHPRKAVVRAMHHRGGKVVTTEDGHFRTSKDAPERKGWVAKKLTPYPDEQEA